MSEIKEVSLAEVAGIKSHEDQLEEAKQNEVAELISFGATSTLHSQLALNPDLRIKLHNLSICDAERRPGVPPPIKTVEKSRFPG